MSEPNTLPWYIERAMILSNEVTANLQHALAVYHVMDKPQERVLFASPVTGKIEPMQTPYGGSWFDATGYAVLYTATGKQCYHTGVDLNLPEFKDSGAPIYAAADGIVVYRGGVQGWQGSVVIIKHSLEDGSNVWTRYAHIDSSAALNWVIKRGEQIGTIADYNKDGPKGDHLHFDVCHADLGAAPGDWPGMDIGRLKKDYIDPVVWLKERGK